LKNRIILFLLIALTAHKVVCQFDFSLVIIVFLQAFWITDFLAILAILSICFSYYIEVALAFLLLSPRLPPTRLNDQRFYNELG